MPFLTSRKTKIVLFSACLLVLAALWMGFYAYRTAGDRQAVSGQWNVSSEILVGRLFLRPANDYSLRIEVGGFGSAGIDSAGLWDIEGDVLVLRPGSGGRVRFQHLENPPRLQWINESGGSDLDEFAADMATMKELLFIRALSTTDERARTD